VTEDQRQTPTNDPKYQQRLASITAKAKEMSTLTPDEIRQKTAQMQAALRDRQKRVSGG
jgi:preprotein translocase subunit SecA